MMQRLRTWWRRVLDRYVPLVDDAPAAGTVASVIAEARELMDDAHRMLDEARHDLRHAAREQQIMAHIHALDGHASRDDVFTVFARDEAGAAARLITLSRTAS